MPGDLTTQAEIIAEEISELRKRVDRLADPTIKRATRELRTSSAKGAWRKLLVEASVAHLGPLLYGLVALVGMLYALGFYERFEIGVLRFFELPDFLLSALASPMVMIAGVVVPLLVLGLLLVVYFAYFTGYANRRAGDTPRSRFSHGALVAGILVTIVATVEAPYEIGKWRSNEFVDSQPPNVRVTIRGDSTQRLTRLPEASRTVLLGTTSAFHFFYECGHPGGTAGEDACERGEPFIVPSDNIAALAYNVSAYASGTKVDSTKGGSGEGSAGQPGVAAAIDKLAEIVSGLSRVPGEEGSAGQPDVAAAIDKLAKIVDGLELAPPVTIENVVPSPGGTPPGIPVGEVTSMATDLVILVSQLATRIDDHCLSNFEHFGTIGPFGLGAPPPSNTNRRSQNEEQEEDASLTLDIERVHRALEARPPGRLFVIGRVDTTQFGDEGLKEHTSDYRLATKRAERVLEQLKEMATDGLRTVLKGATVIPKGPRHVGDAKEEDRAKDRVVTIWGCPKPVEWSPTVVAPV